MGRRGPAPIPTALRILAGETRPSRINRDEPKPTPGHPRMPVDMSAEGKRVWRRVMRDYGATGVLTPADADVLRCYCEAVVRYAGAARQIEQTGPLVRGARQGELVKNPLHQIVRENADLVRSFAREMGLTPAARANLSGAERHAVDPVDEFLDGRRRA